MGAAARRSQARNAARTKSPPAMRPRLVASQLVPPDSTSDQMTARAPTLAETAPARSRAALLAGASGRRSLDKAAPASPTGTFTQNTQCQLSPWVTPPPTSGPAATAKPAMEPHIPITRPRRSGPKAVVRIVRLRGVTIAAPSPCMARAAMRSVVLGARAQAAEARLNIARPATYSRRRPKRSPMLAAGDDPGGEDEQAGVDRPLQGGDLPA